LEEEEDLGGWREQKESRRDGEDKERKKGTERRQ